MSKLKENKMIGRRFQHKIRRWFIQNKVNWLEVEYLCLFFCVGIGISTLLDKGWAGSLGFGLWGVLLGETLFITHRWLETFDKKEG